MEKQFIYIRSGIPMASGPVAIPVSRSVQIKYDNMQNQHKIYIWIAPFGEDKVEVMVMCAGHQLDQTIVDFTDDGVINGIQKVIDDADIPKLLKTFKASLEAVSTAGRKQ